MFITNKKFNCNFYGVCKICWQISVSKSRCVYQYIFSCFLTAINDSFWFSRHWNIFILSILNLYAAVFEMLLATCTLKINSHTHTHIQIRFDCLRQTTDGLGIIIKNFQARTIFIQEIKQKLSFQVIVMNFLRSNFQKQNLNEWKKKVSFKNI